MVLCNSTCRLTQPASQSLCVFDACYFNSMFLLRVHLRALSSSSSSSGSSKQSVHSQQQPQLRFLGCLPICKLSQTSMRWPTHQPELLLAHQQAPLPALHFAVVFNLCVFWHAVPVSKAAATMLLRQQPALVWKALSSL